MIYTIYDPTGEILSTMSFSSAEIAELNLHDKLHIEGEYGDEYYIDNHVPVLKPTKPNGHYDFDYSTKQWVLNTEMAAGAVKARRALLLESVDRVNPMWWNSLTTERQADLYQYRQALLDITTQPGYPTQVEWPIKPIWL
jgi:hypothetical protein